MYHTMCTKLVRLCEISEVQWNAKIAIRLLPGLQYFCEALILDQFTPESRILFIVEIISGILVYDALIHIC